MPQRNMNSNRGLNSMTSKWNRFRSSATWIPARREVLLLSSCPRFFELKKLSMRLTGKRWRGTICASVKHGPYLSKVRDGNLAAHVHRRSGHPDLFSRELREYCTRSIRGQNVI